MSNNAYLILYFTDILRRIRYLIVDVIEFVFFCLQANTILTSRNGTIYQNDNNEVTSSDITDTALCENCRLTSLVLRSIRADLY